MTLSNLDPHTLNALRVVKKLVTDRASKTPEWETLFFLRIAGPKSVTRFCENLYYCSLPSSSSQHSISCPYSFADEWITGLRGGKLTTTTSRKISPLVNLLRTLFFDRKFHSILYPSNSEKGYLDGTYLPRLLLNTRFLLPPRTQIQ